MAFKDKEVQAAYHKKWAKNNRLHLNAYHRKYHKDKNTWVERNKYKGKKWKDRVDEAIEVYKIVKFHAAKNRYERLSIFKKKMIQFHIDYKIFKELNDRLVPQPRD